MNEWNIQSRAHACQACGRHFAHKQAYYTRLLERRHELTREDICAACWEKGNRGVDDSQEGLISHWQGVYHAPPAAPPEAIQKESAETLLRKLIEANDPKHGPACYILAVMLERKRLLKIKEQLRRDGVRVFVYEHSKSGDVFTITDPNLQLNQLEEVQRDVGNLLANGFNPEPQATQTPLPLPEEPEPAPVEASLASPAVSEPTPSPETPPNGAPAPEAPSSPADAQPAD